ncbi:hypothetical protein [Streptacidiphilus sp. PAMC 29251]
MDQMTPNVGSQTTSNGQACFHSRQNAARDGITAPGRDIRLGGASGIFDVRRLR